VTEPFRKVTASSRWVWADETVAPAALNTNAHAITISRMPSSWLRESAFRRLQLSADQTTHGTRR
jgi:hypothetical protein